MDDGEPRFTFKSRKHHYWDSRTWTMLNRKKNTGFQIHVCETKQGEHRPPYGVRYTLLVNGQPKIYRTFHRDLKIAKQYCMEAYMKVFYPHLLHTA